jgi:YegS/Rv2252/BmrU family lipid kinase
MASNRKTAAVVNPHSTGGRTARQWPEISRALEKRLGAVQPCFTERKGDGIGITRGLLREGYDLIIAVGGDGTVNEVANAFLEDDRPVVPEARLGLLPLGTGGDFQRTLGIGTKIEEAVETLASGVPLRIDVGKGAFRGNDGSPLTRYFVNVASFGLGGEVALRAQRTRLLGGKVAFLGATIRAFLGYRGVRARLELDGQPMPSEWFITNIAVGNGQYHGGGMHPCPRAILNDGLLEITVIESLSAFEFARDLRVLYSEDVYRHPKVHHFRARRIVAASDPPARLEVDGEPLGRLPLEATVLERVLPVMVPRSSPLVAGSSAAAA